MYLYGPGTKAVRERVFAHEDPGIDMPDGSRLRVSRQYVRLGTLQALKAQPAADAAYKARRAFSALQ
eukprot:11429904-Alexandrium_andersonii.AAC.1